MPQFTSALHTVRALLDLDAPFEQTEAAIEAAPELDEDERAALWLIAWVGGDPATVAELLGRCGTPDPVVVGAV